MAEIDVQVKKKSSFLPWLLLALGLIALVVYLLRKDDGTMDDDVATATTTVNSTTNNAAADVRDSWNSIDWNAPAARFEEVTGSDINVRGNEDYAIYGLGEDVLFDKGSANIRSNATDNLQQIAKSIKQRYESGQVRVFGFTDATGSADANQQLSAQRAEAVKNWLVQQGGVGADKISLHPQGESSPVASNSTAQGQQQNRRVEIVARKS